SRLRNRGYVQPRHVGPRTTAVFSTLDLVGALDVKDVQIPGRTVPGDRRLCIAGGRIDRVGSAPRARPLFVNNGAATVTVDQVDVARRVDRSTGSVRRLHDRDVVIPGGRLGVRGNPEKAVRIFGDESDL